MATTRQPPRDPLALQLWQQWQRWEHPGPFPDVHAFLAQAGDLPPDRVLAILRVDQHERWRRGERVPVEQYLLRYPRIQAVRTAYTLIYDEILLRQERGDVVALDEYYQRFPHYAEELWGLAGRQVAPNSEASLQFLASRTRWNEDTDIASPRLPRDDATPLTPPNPTLSRKPLSDPAGGRTTQHPAPDVPPAVPGYEVMEVRGRGGMGVVYKARQTALNRLVALKMIRAAALAGPEERARFLAEAKMLARLRHPNIVQIYDVGEHQGNPFLALEYVEGGSLGEWLRQDLPTPAAAARLTQTLAEAMHHAHQQGVIHRDLTAANVLLSAELGARGAGRSEEGGGEGSALRAPRSEFRAPKITDFGLAKQLDADTGQTQSGAIFGTPSYMSPEQAAGEVHAIGPRSDVYSLGVLLYEMLVGRPPFRGARVIDTLTLVCTADPVPPARLQPGVPRDLETICLKCLQKDPRKRYGSALALAKDLGRFLEGEPIKARPVGLVERGYRWCRRHPLPAALTGALVLVIATALLGLTGLYLRAEGLRQEAEENARKARASAEEATQRGAEAAANLAQIYFQGGAFALAQQHFLQALQARELEAARRPEDPNAQYRLAFLRLQYGVLLKESGQPAAAEASYRQALPVFERRAAEAPADPAARRELAACLNNLALLLADTDRLAEAEVLYKRAREIQERLVAQFPQLPDAAIDLGNSYANWGLLLMNRGQPAEALPWFGKAIATLEPFWRSAMDYRGRVRPFLYNSYTNRAYALRKLGRLEESLAALEQARAYPDSLQPERLQTDLGLTLAALGEVAKAQAAVAGFADWPNLTAPSYYDLARIWALCAAKVPAGDSRAERYADRAVEFLRQAKAKGQFTKRAAVEALKQEPDFAALRPRRAYQDFVAELPGG